MRKEIRYMKMAVMNTAGEEQEVCMSILKALEQKRKLRRIRIAVLKVITWIAGVFFFVSILALDMESLPIPVTVTVASGIWLTLIALANN